MYVRISNTTDEGVAPTGFLLSRTWHGVVPDQIPLNVVMNVDFVLTPSANLTTPPHHNATYSMINRRFFSPSRSNFNKDLIWPILLINFNRANRTTGNLSASFPCILIDKSVRRCEYLETYIEQAMNTIPYS